MGLSSISVKITYAICEISYSFYHNKSIQSSHISIRCYDVSMKGLSKAFDALCSVVPMVMNTILYSQQCIRNIVRYTHILLCSNYSLAMTGIQAISYHPRWVGRRVHLVVGSWPLRLPRHYRDRLVTSGNIVKHLS